MGGWSSNGKARHADIRCHRFTLLAVVIALLGRDDEQLGRGTREKAEHVGT